MNVHIIFYNGINKKNNRICLYTFTQPLKLRMPFSVKHATNNTKKKHALRNVTYLKKKKKKSTNTSKFLNDEHMNAFIVYLF